MIKNTQSFDTPKGLMECHDNFIDFINHLHGNSDNRIAGYYYDKAYRSTQLFPPCDVVISLRNDFDNYRLKNILPDLKVIKDDRDKIKY